MKQTPRPTPKARTQKTPATRRNHAKTEREQDPVQVNRSWSKCERYLTIFLQVFCRVRPLSSEEIENCVEVISGTVVQLVPPLVSYILFMLPCYVVALEFRGVQIRSQEWGKEKFRL